MKDKLGLYYYPLLENKALRMYVRPNKDELEFRLWSADDPGLWKEHGWVPWSAIQQAAELYKKEKRKGKPPVHMYDLDIAMRLVRDAARSNKT